MGGYCRSRRISAGEQRLGCAEASREVRSTRCRDFGGISLGRTERCQKQSRYTQQRCERHQLALRADRGRGETVQTSASFRGAGAMGCLESQALVLERFDTALHSGGQGRWATRYST